MFHQIIIPPILQLRGVFMGGAEWAAAPPEILRKSIKYYYITFKIPVSCLPLTRDYSIHECYSLKFQGSLHCIHQCEQNFPQTKITLYFLGGGAYGTFGD